MKPILTFAAALSLAGCERAAEPAAGNSAAVLPSQARASTPPAVVPRPKDEAKLDDLILAGYTPHADHLHAPGVKACPLSKGNGAVM